MMVIFCTSRIDAEDKIQETVNYCVVMHEATGGKVNEEKVMVTVGNGLKIQWIMNLLMCT